MNNLGAYLTGRRGPDWRRRDFAVPAVVLALQVAGTFVAVHRHPALHLTVLDWLLLGAGPPALTPRRFHRVAVLWVTLAATLSPSGSPAANFSLVVAFLTAATSGHRRGARTRVVVRQHG